MDQKNDMICDMTTGICGPAGENVPMTGFIDLSAPQEKIEAVNLEKQNPTDDTNVHE